MGITTRLLYQVKASLAILFEVKETQVRVTSDGSASGRMLLSHRVAPHRKTRSGRMLSGSGGSIKYTISIAGEDDKKDAQHKAENLAQAGSVEEGSFIAVLQQRVVQDSADQMPQGIKDEVARLASGDITISAPLVEIDSANGSSGGGGGDVSKVTVIGASAGALFVTALLLAMFVLRSKKQRPTSAGTNLGLAGGIKREQSPDVLKNNVSSEYCADGGAAGFSLP